MTALPLALSHTKGAALVFEPNPEPVMIMVPTWLSAPLAFCTSGMASAGCVNASLVPGRNRRPTGTGEGQGAEDV